MAKTLIDRSEVVTDVETGHGRNQPMMAGTTADQDGGHDGEIMTRMSR